jgi:hypothetical protein
VSLFIPPTRPLATSSLSVPISWFLDNPELNWTPPQTLIDWMAKARADEKPIVYIGFGSITVPNPKLVTERLIRGVLKSKSWPYPLTDLTVDPRPQVACVRLSPKAGQPGWRKPGTMMSNFLKNAILYARGACTLSCLY